MDNRNPKFREILRHDMAIFLVIVLIAGVVAYLEGVSRFAFQTPATPTFILRYPTTPTTTPTPLQPPAPELPTLAGPPRYPSSSACDEFEDAFLNAGWEWIDPKGDSYFSLTDIPGSLMITVSGPDHDLYENLNAPRLLQNVQGDFTVTTMVTIYPEYNYQAAGLLYWQDADNYVRLERTLVSGIDLLYRIRGEYKAVEISFFTSPTFLMFEMSGLTLQGFYSEDGDNWTSIEPVQVPLSSHAQIGIDVVNEWQDNSITAYFDYFKFSYCP
jgi:hypothetical protein